LDSGYYELDVDGANFVRNIMMISSKLHLQNLKKRNWPKCRRKEKSTEN
jgi:hypothetical protein